MNGLAEGLRMLDLFASVGADRYYVTKTDLLENKTRAWPATPERLRHTLPAILRAAAVRKPSRTPEGTIMAGENVIVRPMSHTLRFIQLDDLSASALDRVRPAAFLTLATSPGNHQAWIAVSGIPEGKEAFKEFMRRVRKAVGGNDKSASHATRLAGTENFKLKYYPAFPAVAIVEAVPGHIVAAEQLERLGLVAPPEPAKEPLPLFVLPAEGGRRGGRAMSAALTELPPPATTRVPTAAWPTSSGA
jgi:hypothetical protein